MKSILIKQLLAFLTAIALVLLPAPVIAAEGGSRLRHRRTTNPKFIEHDENPIEGEYIIVLADSPRNPDDALDDIVEDAGPGASRFTDTWSIGSQRGNDISFRGGGVMMDRDQVSPTSCINIFFNSLL